MRVLLHAMKVVILVFRLPPKTPPLVSNKFCQRLYGQEVSSWGGRYRYRRAGLLDKIPHRRLGRGVVIVRERDLGTIIEFLSEWKAATEWRAIKPTVEDCDCLRAAGQ